MTRKRARRGMMAVDYAAALMVLFPLAVGLVVLAAKACGVIHQLVASVVGLSLM